jgi:hypothetical protein
LSYLIGQDRRSDIWTLLVWPLLMHAPPGLHVAS